jgi:Ca-activated chloride channel family protein
MLVLDASGSMNTKDGDSSGASRMSVAKKAATSLVNDLPSGAKLGLTVYGANTSSAASAKAKGCKDVVLTTPVGTNNASALKSGISGAKASGYTPIGTALKKAAAALPKDGDRAIVLVSDGIDSCSPPPPCEVASDLKDQGVDLTIHTIGFRVGERARMDLSCIAQATGGEYSDAQDGDQLADQLKQRATRAMQGYEVSGEPINGGDRIGDATAVKPGTYLDTLKKGSDSITDDGSDKYYAVHVSDGERVHASATVVPPPGNAHWSDAHSLYTEMEVVGQDGNSCSDDISASGNGEGPSDSGDMPLVAAVNSKPVGDKDNGDSCNADTLYLHVSRSGPAHKNDPFPLELVVALEKPGAAPKGSPATKVTKDTQGAKQVKPKSEKPVQLGRSFAKATLVEPGSFVTDLVPGDVRMVKIPVHQGQRLRYRAEAVDLGGNSYGAYERPTLNMNFYNPLRMPVTIDDVQRTEYVTLDSGHALTGGFQTPVNAANRDVDGMTDDATTIASNWLGGDQYVMLNLSQLTHVKSTDKNEPVRVQITFQVDGTAQKGVHLTTSHDAPMNTAVNDQGKKGTAVDAGGTKTASDHRILGLSRTGLTGGAIGAGVIAIAAIIGATVLIRRRKRS